METVPGQCGRGTTDAWIFRQMSFFSQLHKFNLYKGWIIIVPLPPFSPWHRVSMYGASEDLRSVETQIACNTIARCRPLQASTIGSSKPQIDRKHSCIQAHAYGRGSHAGHVQAPASLHAVHGHRHACDVFNLMGAQAERWAPLPVW